MKFGVYAVRDIKNGFQSITVQSNDPTAVRGFQSAVMQSDSVLFTHAEDFALYRLGSFDADSGRIDVLDMPLELIQAKTCLK